MSSTSSASGSTPPSPTTSTTSVEGLSNLSLQDVSEENKKAAAELKARANKAFGGKGSHEREDE